MSARHGPLPCVRHARLYDPSPIHFCPRCSEELPVAEVGLTEKENER